MDKLIEAEDDVIISYYLKKMIDNETAWNNRFLQDVDVFNKNPREVFNSKNPNFVFVKSGTDKTDGCESGCWRTIGSDKLIKSRAGKILGFKKILKFWEKKKPREYKINWVMEEFRFMKKGNKKQYQVICRIWLMFDTEIRDLLAKHFSYIYTSSSSPNYEKVLFPNYRLPATELPEDVDYLQMIIDIGENNCTRHFLRRCTKDVYCLEPWKHDVSDPRCFFVAWNKSCGRTDGCDGGCWRSRGHDKVIKSEDKKILGFKRVFKFCEKVKRRCEHTLEYTREGINGIWIMEEYRLVKKKKQVKVICVIRYLAPILLNYLLRR